MIIDFLFALLGLIVLIGIAFAFSDNRSHINWRQVGMGISLQIIFALFIILVPWGSIAFDYLAKFFVKIISFTYNGADFVFGFLAWTEKVAQVTPHQGGFIFVFQVLPTLIFFSSLMSVLYHLGIMQRIVQGMAWVMAKTLKISGAESISVAANVFIGQTEAPLVVRPYVDTMTKSELLTLMIGGMATIAGGVLAAYVGLLGGSDPVMQVFYAKHLLGASIMAAPATIVIAKILRPELEHSSTMGKIDLKIETKNSNVIEAAASGASDGMSLALNVAAMLLAFIALIAMINWLIGLLLTDIFGITIGGQAVSLEIVLGYVLSPIAFIIGVPWADSVTVGSLIGQKVVINEFIAYLNLAKVESTLSPKAIIISTYALCGFANFSSIAIQIGGIGGIAPSRRSEIARNGLLAILGGSLATFMTATIAGFLTSL